MKLKLGVLLFASSAMIAPAAAQQQGQPNPNQAAAKAILQAADKAIGASSVRSVVATGTGWIGSPGQQYAQGDLPRADIKSFTLARDFVGKSGKFDYMRVQGNNPPRGGGGIPVQGELRTAEFVNGNSAWTLNAQGQPVAQPGAAADRQHLMLTGPVGFIRAGLEAPNAAPPTSISRGKTAPSKSWASTSKSAISRSRNAPAG